MLRFIIPALIALAASAAHAQPPASQLAQRSAESFLVPCPPGNRECEQTRAAFVAAWPRAVRGEYQAARNAAFFLTNTRATPPMRMDPVAACALRKAIIAAGHPETDMSDVTNLRFTCLQHGPRLMPAGLPDDFVWNQAALEGLLLARIARQNREAAAPAAPPAGRPLDGTATPLQAPQRPR
jgi:hypothetical protein